MDLLQTGDRLRTPADGEATLIFLADGQREQLKSKTEASVGVHGCSPAGRRPSRLPGPKLRPANLASLRGLVGSSRGGLGVLRGDPPPKPQAVTPLYGGSVWTRRPTLTWPDAKADAYLVQLFNGAEGMDERLLWKTTAKEARLSFPDQEKPLEFSLKYRWRVTPLKGEDASADPIVDSYFLILTEDEIKPLDNLKPLLESKAPADLLLAAVSYEAHGVYDGALRLYERLAEMSPEEASFQNALASYYGRAGRKDLAEIARKQAEKLRK